MKRCFLQDTGPYATYVFYPSIAEAKEAFRTIAEALAQYEQKYEATVHIADNEDEIAEYPDYVLSLGPRGGLKVERT